MTIDIKKVLTLSIIGVLIFYLVYAVSTMPGNFNIYEVMPGVINFIFLIYFVSSFYLHKFFYKKFKSGKFSILSSIFLVILYVIFWGSFDKINVFNVSDVGALVALFLNRYILPVVVFLVNFFVHHFYYIKLKKISN